MKVGILGGTFDPVHGAHLAMAGAALRHLALDEVLFVPTGTTRYRKPATASGEDRVAMLGLALEGEPRYRIDERELGAGATGYTVDTLRALRRERPRDELFLLIGGDQLAKFGSWHEPDEVRRLAKLAVFQRPGAESVAAETLVVPMAQMAISASAIRARAARGDDLSDCVPAGVAGYILRHGLYR